MEKIHFKTLDFAKYIACLLIVMRHCHPFGVSNSMDGIMKCFTAFPVPFFFAASSFLFFHNHGSIKKYLFRMSQLYVVWFVIEFPVVYKRFFYHTPNLTKFFSGLFFHNTFYESWYLMASLLGLIIVYVCSKKFNFNNIGLLFVGMIFFLLALIYSTYHDLFIGTLIGDTIDRMGRYITFSNSFFSSIIYIVIGKILADHFDRNKDKGIFPDICFALILFVFFIVEYKFTGKFSEHSRACCLFLIPFVYFLLRICIKCFKRNMLSSDLAITLRISSIIIYLSHPLLLIFVADVFGFKNNWIQYVVVIALTQAISIFIQKKQNKYRILSYLY